MSCSKKKWGYTFLGFGVTFFVIGIVCGFVIPKIVIGIVEDQACIDSEADSGFDKWVEEKPDSIITRLYYWEITNKEGVLYNGELPKLEERGPYVYKQTTKKVDVKFKDDKRSSKTWKITANFSKEKSCDKCSEDDKITVLNIGYVVLMEKFGSDETFVLVYLSKTISTILQQFNNSFEQLGSVNQTVWKDTQKSGWKNPGFGAWGNEAFTAVEMRGLYSVLNSSVLLFGETLVNSTVKEQCSKEPVEEKCGFLAHMKAAVFTPNQTAFTALLNNKLCPNAQRCFKRFDPRAILKYIQHVNQYTMWLILGEQEEIVKTVSQKKIALGYKMANAINPTTGEPVAVPGIVKVHATKTEAINNATESTFYTCKAGSEKKHQWATYAGKNRTNVNLNMTPEESMVRGYSTIVPRSKTANKPCIFSHELPYKSVEIFASELGMRVRVFHTGETTLHGLKLKRFTPTKEDFLNHSGVQQGYIDVSKARGFPLYLSFAHLLYGNVTVPKSFNQKPDLAKHQSTVDIQAVTGLLTSAFMRIQVNVPIKKNIVSVPRIEGLLNISYLADSTEKLYLKSIPVLWGEYGGEASADDIDKIKKKVIGTLGLACGILIALPVLGSIFIIVAIILIVIGTKANQTSDVSSK